MNWTRITTCAKCRNSKVKEEGEHQSEYDIETVSRATRYCCKCKVNRRHYSYITPSGTVRIF